MRFELLAGVREKEVERWSSSSQRSPGCRWGRRWPGAAGSLAQRHRRSHGGIDDADYLIAATALLLEADLLMTNVRRFPMITGLQPAY